MEHSNASNRINRLPILKVHYFVLYALAIAYFFEFADNNIFSAIVPQLIKSWGITVNQVALITAISCIGMFIGSAIASWIADQWGRKKGLIITIFWYSIFSMLTGFSWDILSMIVFRTITAAGLAAMTVIAAIYINEIYPASVKGKFQAYVLVIGTCGTPITVLLASFIVPLTDWTWRLVFLWGALGIVGLLLFRHFSESPKWYEMRGEYDKADAIVAKMEADALKKVGTLPEAPAYVQPPYEMTPKFSDFFKGRYFKITLVLSILWITQSLGFYGFANWAPMLLAKEGFSTHNSIFLVALSTMGAPLGSYLASLVSDRFERKWCIVAFGSIIGVGILLYGFTFNPIFIILFGFIANTFERGYTALGYAYSPAIYDIRMRSKGTGISYGLGRLSNALGPLIIASLYNGSGYQSVFYFIAGAWFVGAITVALFGPRVKV